MTVSILLFTRDLRVRDNPSLIAAHAAATEVVPLFVVDERIVCGPRSAPNRARFLAAALAELDAELRSIGGRLVVRSGDVPSAVEQVVVETGAESLHLAADVSWYARRREAALRRRLGGRGCTVHAHPAAVTATDPADLRPSSGRDHFAVFTPYYRRWLELPMRRPLQAPRRVQVADIAGDALPDFAAAAPDSSPRLAVGGAITARKSLARWLLRHGSRYVDESDRLGADATSRLSPYLHFGCLSPIEVLHRVPLTTPSGQAFARQLAWRDFHHQVLAARPEAAWQDYRPRRPRPREDEQAVAAWRAGRTGFPIVDAGLRQLLEEGWMPGRARLIAASFLTKSLGVDWRIGAAHFRRWLVDADVANNQMNWQWIAGTGTDTRPNRVLNPLRQAERYDPDGDYVRRWLPELADIPAAAAHRPWRHLGACPSYPPPIIECKGM
ncbi:MAG: deoxyribodipyrimidine photo-lyase [Mycobacteriaceae bacterium]|nr:deoxyribodipyrimidine photo-lyase [Mycobacteriaceae bacterium]